MTYDPSQPLVAGATDEQVKARTSYLYGLGMGPFPQWSGARAVAVTELAIALRDECAALTAERDALRADAERWNFVRDGLFISATDKDTGDSEIVYQSGWLDDVANDLIRTGAAVPTVRGTISPATVVVDEGIARQKAARSLPAREGVLCRVATQYDNDYALVVPGDPVYSHSAELVDGFNRSVAYVHLWGQGSPDAIWLVQVRALWSSLSLWLFDDRYREQKKFRSKEEAIQFIERRLGLKRCAVSPFIGAVNPRSLETP